ncbi:hypothetical protein M413DRAFT_25840 [Hebeloma cylindrosporum]|uniref:F-box domain-containing protein n=1 Tax=Hebeloma cylindrosporum TaxID=76867 RepID=A0A0C3CIM9_HEBCY|nr:hypothetical protein M413DRAFT_25840 [Hebeloma cylindrosporum h7]
MVTSLGILALNRMPEPSGVLQKRRLTDLPLEILIAILEESEWRGVLQLRKTCMALYEASKAQSIWLKLCKGYLAPSATSPQVLHLERPVQMYNSEELEFLFLRFHGAEIAWRREDTPPSRKITTTTRAAVVHLIEGGRWLLLVSNVGSVTYLDLDSDTINETVLIPGQIDDPTPMLWRNITMWMDVDIDRASPFLAFNIAFSFCSLEDTRGPMEHKIQVWHVDLVLDERQLGVGLTAQRVATFPLEMDIRILRDLSLLGPHVAFAVRCRRYVEPEKTFVVDWNRANGRSNYPRRLIHPAYGPEAIYLLPNAKLFVLLPYGVYLFDFSTVEETTSLPSMYDPEDTVARLWGAEFKLYPKRLSTSSPYFYTGTTVRFVVRGLTGIYGVTIDYHSSNPFSSSGAEPGRVVKLMDFPSSVSEMSRDAHIFFGSSSALILDGKMATYLVRYSWPDNRFDDSNDDDVVIPASSWLRMERTLDCCRLGVAVDVESGRVVVSGTSPDEPGHHHIVLDYSLVY